MKDKKDIFELFREGGQNIEARPPERSWQKLEARLDQKGKRRRLPIYRQLSLAAAVIALLVLVSVVTLLLPQYSNKQSAELAIPTNWEELGPYADAGDDAYKMVAYQRKYLDRLDGPLPEGEPDRRIVVQGKAALNAGRSSAPLASASNEPQASTKSKIESVSGAELASSMADEADETATSNAMDLEEAKMADSDDVQFADKPQEEAPAMEDNAASTYGMARARTEASQKKEPAVNVAQFDWLLGSWQGNAPAGYQIENWRQVNPTTLEGRGQLIEDGDTVLIEKMRIQQFEGQIYYLVDTDGSGHFQRYLLVDYGAEQAVFENNAVDFPQQIILQPGIRNQQYSTTLQNASPSKLDTKQESYLNQRNYINVERVQRSLRRAN